MARNLIMGKYFCALRHAHSTADEVEQCNRITEERQKREQSIIKQKQENVSKEHSLEKQRLDIKQQKIERGRQRQEAMKLKQKQDHEKHMAELELKKLEIEREIKQLEHEEKMTARQNEKNVSSMCVVS